ncbi:DUF6172 family protein [Pseudocolwellia agarivorans]|uniref:DUF6172 family protein n=1 Tax=Pseudocolwellia agarivorans TaxID=1911682 RepID=UPI000987B68E|nr:DUF6172 family protein [Pseudocolwellia agarivorans]
MKKTFTLTHPKIKYERLIDGVKHDVKKYIKRERNKTLPVDADYWDFDCKFGLTEAEAEEVHLTEINKHIDKAASENLTSFYIEIIAKEGFRQFKSDIDDEEDED